MMLSEYLIGSVLIFSLLLLLVKKMELRRRWALPWILSISPLGMWLASFHPLFLPVQSFIIRFSVAFFLSVVASILVILCFFYRDPQRIPPADPRTILSPADGKIIYINKLQNNRFPIALKKGKVIPLTEFTAIPFPVENGFQIGIMMSYLDVHVNRSPITGRIDEIKKIPGAFRSLKHMDSLLENERVLTVISGSEGRIGVVQIASRIVRRIVPFINKGDSIRQGDRIGMIRFGSQVDVLIPDGTDLIIVVKVGDYIKAGMSILARYQDENGEKMKE